MPLGPQPRNADGTVEHPNSALRLRFVLAAFGVVVCIAGGILVWFLVHAVAIAVVFFAFAVVAAIDLGVVATRIRRGG